MNKFIKEYGLLLLILLVGSWMRFYQFSEFSLTNDELSALFRSFQLSFGELIHQGVLDTDPHPAGVQVFLYYWINCFGDSAFVIRLPFVVLSVLTIFMSYKLSEKWFGKYTGLLVATAVATFQFPILFGQLARPYSVGLFFGITVVYFWTSLLFDEQRKWIKVAAYAFFSAACCYTHYFCGLFAVVVGVTGLFFMNKSNWKYYLIANGIVIGLFLPHVSITLHHLETGGLSGWLPKPTWEFFYQHFLFLFNSSFILLGVSFLLAAYLAWHYRKDIAHSRFRMVSISWFLFPLIVGYIYSMNHETVLMDRVLLFTFPYLLIFMFSFIQPKKADNRFYVGFALLLFTGIYSTGIEKKFYTIPHFEDFKLITEKTMLWEDKYGKENITNTINVNSLRYLDYYFDEINYETTFELNQIINGEHLKELSQLIENAETPYFLAGWACIYNPYEIPELIKRKYPVEVERVHSFNTELILYGKDVNTKRQPVLQHKMGFEQSSENWSYDDRFLDSLTSYSGKWSYRMEAESEYGPTFKTNLQAVIEDTANVITVTAHCYGEQPLSGLLVMSIEREGESLAWYSANVSDYITEQGVWQEIILSKIIPDGAQKNDQVVVYFWNRNKDQFWMDNLEINSFKDSYYNYYD